jgi:hypothetical protein
MANTDHRFRTSRPPVKRPLGARSAVQPTAVRPGAVFAASRQAASSKKIRDYHEARPYQGRWCFGKTPMQTEGQSLGDELGGAAQKK